MCEITVDISNINYKTDTCHSKKKKRKKKKKEKKIVLVKCVPSIYYKAAVTRLLTKVQ